MLLNRQNIQTKKPVLSLTSINILIKSLEAKKKILQENLG